MINKIRGLFALGLSALLTGCVLAPQTIALSDSAQISGKTTTPRAAMVRVIDERGVAGEVLGTRGGRSPEDSPLVIEKPLDQILTKRLQNTLEQLGFGEENDNEPLKVQLDIQAFDYKCNESLVANECSIKMRFLLTAFEGGKTFKKPYGSNQMRSLAASPIAEYNEKWVNEMLDEVWQYMFSDSDLKQFMGVY